MARYSERFSAALSAIETDTANAADRLERYTALYAGVLRGERMCLCGMLAAEYPSLDPSLRGAVIRFFDDNETWLERVLADGARDGSLHYHGSPREIARSILSSLEGAMLVARTYGQPERFAAASSHLRASLASH